jgi:hypothetical protein
MIPAAKNIATIAQLAVQPIRNPLVMGSNRLCGSLKSSGFSLKNGVFRKENHYVFK